MGIQTQICGILLLLIVLFLRILQPVEQMKKKSMYMKLLISGIVCLFLDAFSVVVIANANGEYGLYVRFVCKSYLVSLDVTVCMAFLYLTSNLEKHIPHISVLRKICYVWGAIFVLLICYLPIKVNNENGRIYTYGASVSATYFVAASMIFAIITVLIANKKNMEGRRWLAGMMWMVSWIAIECVQLTHPELLLVGFAIALGITIVFIQLETPDYRNLQTTMKQLEAARQEAIDANKAKSNFLAQMSHEIRTPINAVLGMNEMILRESNEENILVYASNAYNSGNALLSIINDVLDISKIEAGKAEITETDYSLFSLISDCYHMTADRAEKKGLKFSAVCDESLPCSLKGDVFHIRQIVVNLLTNAIKYTDRGSVELSISSTQKGNAFSLVFTVKDTGIGLKQESMEKLFDSFQRFDLEHNQSVEGTGLGLSICKQLTELMKGNITVSSVYGEGSVFSCTIPQEITDKSPIGRLCLDRPAARIENAPQNMFIAPEARILVVDDVEMNIFVFINFLKKHEMRIDTASSGRTCLELASKNKYDMIFMDHMMPEMDGMDTFEQLKTQNLISSDTAVIMLTANALSGDENKYTEAGFNSYLTKPVNSEKLVECLLKFLPSEKVIYKEGIIEKAAGNTDIAAEKSPLLDVQIGLTYNGGDKDAYCKVLSMYVGSGQEKIEKMRRYSENGEWKDYVTEVHALKSTSLMIGSKELSEAAKELESAGKSKNYDVIKEKNENVISLYSEVMEAVKKYLEATGYSPELYGKETKKSELTEVPLEKVSEYIDRIKSACDSFIITDIMDVFDETKMCSFNGISLSEFFLPIKESVDNFDYETAAKIADELINKL